MFSPYYRRALRRDAATDPLDHCALNVCLYGPGAARWTMTERGARRVERSARSFTVGPSRLDWSPDGTLTIRIDERSAPFGRRVRGLVRVHARALNRTVVALDAAGRHRWKPLAPCARLEVDLDVPALRWHGEGYLDANEGDEPIERGFERWDWLRTVQPGATTVVYDVQARGEAPAPPIARRFDAHGVVQAVELPAAGIVLPPSPLWRIDRRARAAARVQRTLEDTPFYARSLIELAPLGGTGAATPAVHETLDVRRLASPIVQALLPFRMPRRP